MREIEKSGWMYIVIGVVWILVVLWFDPRLFVLLHRTHNDSGKILILLFMLTLDLFWLFGCYYLFHFVFTLISPRTIPPAGVDDQKPQVAILYLTMNDFDVAAAESCAHQNYPHFHLYLLDDSTTVEGRKAVEQFHERFPELTTIVRRQNRKGYKAGSINNALRTTVLDCEYFAVIDSDGVIPSDFVTRMLPYFRLDPQIGFLQARNVPNPVQRTKFASDLALGITPLWTSYFGPRNKYGFVPFLGHSGLISRKLWEKTGGMPEVVSEDLAFSTKAAELGYRGHYVHDVFAQEQFPETYPQLRRQQEKYVKGGCEFIHRCLPFFLAAKDVTWFEKLDVIMSCATLFLPTLHLLFVVVFGILLAPLFGDARQLHVTIGGTSYALWKAYVLDSSFAGIWRWDFNLITALCTIAPLLGCFSVVRKQAFRLVRLIILSTVPYLSLMLVCTIGIIAYAFTGKAAFLVTADSTATSGLYASEGTNRNLLESINSSHRLMYKLELWLGAVLSILCLRTLNVTLFVFCFSVCMGPVLIRYGWDCRPLKAVMYIPFLVMFAAATQLGINLAACQGAFLPLFSFHF